MKIEKCGSGCRFDGQKLILLVMVRGVCVVHVGASRAAGFHARPERFVHDLLDGARATSALGATAQTIVNLPGGTRKAFAGHRASHVVIGDDVAGTNNHGSMLGNPVKTWGIDNSRRHGMQSQRGYFQAIPNWDAIAFPSPWPGAAGDESARTGGLKVPVMAVRSREVPSKMKFPQSTFVSK
jgi:hypothetical protein